jgi:N-acetylmuramoyl-L-alanine amidase
MQRSRQKRILSGAIVFALVFCLTARPVLNAADPDTSAARKTPSLAEDLFRYASAVGRVLHDRPTEERSLDDYRRALDAYGQVIRLNTDNYFSAESLARRAELLREMADVTGDSALYLQSIETYRRVVSDHPQSSLVGDALIAIAQIYEEALQDLDGAAGAYRELITYFPSSVLAREGRAVLARFDAQLARRPVDVEPRARVIGGDEILGPPRLTNVRNFTGPDYARLVIDLSSRTSYTARRTAGNHLAFSLPGSIVAPSLYGRRFIVGESSLLKRIMVSENPVSGVQIDIELNSAADYSTFGLSDPERLVIDLHAGSSNTDRREDVSPAAPRESTRERRGVDADSTPGAATARNRSSSDGRPLLSLPEISEPIVPSAGDTRGASPAHSAVPTKPDAKSEAKPEAKAAESSVKRIVIDPGHGGHDTGTISSNGMKEKDLVLDVARRLRAYIKNNYPDVEVIMTRDSDKFIALEERTAIANSRRADLFISVHANSSPAKAASGVETYFVSPDRVPAEDQQTATRENSTIAAAKPAVAKAEDKPQPMIASVTVGNRVAESRELARYIQSGLVRGIGAQSPRTASNRGVKHAAFVVLLGATMPSVLAEVSFLSNPKDEALLQTSSFRERIAASLFAGLNAYLRRRPPEAKGK